MKHDDSLSEETAGVGHYDGDLPVYYMWALKDNEVTVVFDNGEYIRFDNDSEGWATCADAISKMSQARRT